MFSFQGRSLIAVSDGCIRKYINDDNSVNFYIKISYQSVTFGRGIDDDFLARDMDAP